MKQKSKFIYYTGVIAIVFVVLAFGVAAMVQPHRVERYFKPLVIVHIIASLGWLLLFVQQSRLALKGNIEKHRKNLNIATILVVLSTLIAVYITYAWGDTRRLIGESRDILVFAGLFFLSISFVNKGKIETHKRLMLIALLNLITPAWTRVGFIFEWTPPVLVLAMILTWIIVPLVYDIFTIRKIHKATIAGISLTLISFALVIAIVLSPWFETINAWLYPNT